MQRKRARILTAAARAQIAHIRRPRARQPGD